MVDSGVPAGSATDDLGSSIGQMLGELGSESAPEESGRGTDAGAPPADAPLTDPQSSPTPDVAPDGEPPAEGSAPAPATPDDTAPADEADPLASSKPLTYTVDGKERAVEGIRVIGDEAIITRDALPDVIRRLGERDHLFERSQWANQESQRTEALGAWKTTDENGTERMLTGLEGVSEMRVSHARLEAALATLVGVLQDPASIRQMIAVDESDNIVLNQAFMDGVLTRSELAEIRAEQSTRSIIGQLAQAAQPAPPPPDFKQFAPNIIKQAAGDKLSVLSPKDQQTLGAQMLRYVRPTTPAERQQGHGAHIVDAEFTTVVQEWIGMRSEGVKAATVASTAATSNAARIAAARQGAPPLRTGARPIVPPKPAPAGETEADRAWAARERAAAGALRR